MFLASRLHQRPKTASKKHKTQTKPDLDKRQNVWKNRSVTSVWSLHKGINRQPWELIANGLSFLFSATLVLNDNTARYKNIQQTIQHLLLWPKITGSRKNHQQDVDEERPTCRSKPFFGLRASKESIVSRLRALKESRKRKEFWKYDDFCKHVVKQHVRGQFYAITSKHACCLATCDHQWKWNLKNPRQAWVRGR